MNFLCCSKKNTLSDDEDDNKSHLSHEMSIAKSI